MSSNRDHAGLVETVAVLEERVKTGQAGHTARIAWLAADAPMRQGHMIVANAIMIGVCSPVFALSIRLQPERRHVNAAVAVATLVLAVSANPAGAHSISDACVSIYWTGEKPCNLADHKGTVSRGWEAGNICSQRRDQNHGGDGTDLATAQFTVEFQAVAGEVRR